MAKLAILSGKDVCKILARRGVGEMRRRGSRVVMQPRTSAGTTTVRVPDHAELPIGTSQSIIRQSGLPRFEFET